MVPKTTIRKNPRINLFPLSSASRVPADDPAKLQAAIGRAISNRMGQAFTSPTITFILEKSKLVMDVTVLNSKGSKYAVFSTRHGKGNLSYA